MSSTKNSCYTYFRITGYFDPSFISDTLGLSPERELGISEK